MPDLRKKYKVVMMDDGGKSIYTKTYDALSCYDAMEYVWHDFDAPNDPTFVHVCKETVG